MKAIAKTQPGKGASLIDAPIPEPTDNGVLIKVECSAICGTDIHIYNWDPTGISFCSNMVFPKMMGHEMAGTIVAVGDKVSQKRIGQRVALETHMHCGECYMCRTGNEHVCLNMNDSSYQKYGDSSFAEYKLTTENMLYVLPDDISFEEGALYEPGGVAMYAQEDSHMNPGDVVVIYGCGPIGLMAMQIYKACGAGKIIGIDVNEFRINMAKKYADVVINGTKDPALDIVREISQAHGGTDVIVEATGASSVYKTMFQMARPEAHIILIGHPNGEVPINIMRDVNLKSLNIKGHFGRSIWSCWDKLNALQASKRIDLLDTVTHRFTLEQYEEAFEVSMKDSGKVLFIHGK
ncbi:MAG: alcohol dehydrogenase catalytic domain-containing protein [Bacillota bacterium]|jgi:threonine 3-dehydrogenase